MKNSILLLILMISFIFNSCTFPLIVKPSGKVSKVTIPISDFDGISVSDGIQLFATKDNFEKIEIETDDNVQSLYTAQKIGNTLTIGLNRNTNFRPEQVVKVYISYKNLIDLKANSGCVVNMLNAHTTDSFNLDISHGSTLKGMLFTKILAQKVTYGSQADLNGSTDRYNLVASEGCKINDFSFISNTMICDISHGSVINTTVNSTIDVIANHGAILNFKGNAIINSKNLQNGSQINKL